MTKSADDFRFVTEASIISNTFALHVFHTFTSSSWVLNEKDSYVPDVQFIVKIDLICLPYYLLLER